MRFALQPEWKEADINIGWSAHNPPPRLTNSQEHQLTMMILWWFLAYQFFSQHVSKAKLRGVLLRRPAHPDDDADDDDDNDDDDDDEDDKDDKDYLVMLLLMLQPSDPGWLMISDWLSTGRSTFVLIIISSG